MAASESTVLGVSLFSSSIFASTFFSVPLIDLGSGMLACAIGVAGRAAYDLQRALKRGDPIKMQKTLGWVSAGLLGSPMATIGVMVAYQAYFKTEPNAAVALFLLAFGFGGQDIIGPIWTAVARYLNKKFGLGIDVEGAKEDVEKTP